MANNRMALVCSVCNEGIAIGKYYPSTGWYFIENDKRRDDWMNRHWLQCGVQYHQQGHQAFRLAYESDGMKDWHYVGDPENAWSAVAKQRDDVLRKLNDAIEKEKPDGTKETPGSG